MLYYMIQSHSVEGVVRKALFIQGSTMNVQTSFSCHSYSVRVKIDAFHAPALILHQAKPLTRAASHVQEASLSYSMKHPDFLVDCPSAQWKQVKKQSE
jgi:hypothetical protein